MSWSTANLALGSSTVYKHQIHLFPILAPILFASRSAAAPQLNSSYGGVHPLLNLQQDNPTSEPRQQFLQLTSLRDPILACSSRRFYSSRARLYDVVSLKPSAYCAVVRFLLSKSPLQRNQPILTHVFIFSILPSLDLSRTLAIPQFVG